MALAALVFATSDPTSSPTTQWTALGLLAAVLIAVGRGVWSLLDRADKRVVAAEVLRQSERERDLAMQERLAAALIASAEADHRSTEVVGRLADGLTEVRHVLEQLQTSHGRQEAALLKLEVLMR